MTALNDVPAFKSEPYMPPEDQLRAWMLVYYEDDKNMAPDKFWKELGKQDYARFKPLIKTDGDIKRAAAELVSGLDKAETNWPHLTRSAGRRSAISTVVRPISRPRSGKQSRKTTRREIRSSKRRGAASTSTTYSQRSPTRPVSTRESPAFQTATTPFSMHSVPPRISLITIVSP